MIQFHSQTMLNLSDFNTNNLKDMNKMFLIVLL